MTDEFEFPWIILYHPSARLWSRVEEKLGEENETDVGSPFW